MKSFSGIRRIFVLSSIALIACGMAVKADDFMDKGASRSFIEFGVRLGINSSTQKINHKDIYSDTQRAFTEWKTGFEVGAVIDLNIRDYFALQPGFFFQNKSYDYTVLSANFGNGTMEQMLGHTRFYYFQIPVRASLRFNLSHDFRWHIDFGPYFAFGLGGDNEMEVFKAYINEGNGMIERKNYKEKFFGDGDGNIVGMKTFDWGAKLGTAFTFKRHYSLGIHYNWGFKNIANSNIKHLKKASAYNREWVVSLGYNF